MDSHPTPPKNALADVLDALGRGGDFPALSSTLTEINRAVRDEHGRSNALTEVILRDFALTNKLLRLVNAAHYASFGSQPISTISRAVVILGHDAVRDAAVSLMLFEHLRNHAQARVLQREAVESFFCGVLGRLLAPVAGAGDGEEAYLSALFRNLGRLMAHYHFFDRTQRVAQLMQEQGLAEAAAARREFGVDYDQLGLAIAKLWHFPPGILHAMAPIGAGPIRAPGGQHGRLQVVANLARELHETYARELPPDKERAALEALCERYRLAARTTPPILAEAARQAAEVVLNEADILKADVDHCPMLKRLLAARPDAEPPLDGLADSLAGATAEPAPADPAGALAMGMQDLTSLLLGEYRIGDVFKLVAELYYRTGSFDRVLFCVLDKVSQTLQARVALGRGAEGIRGAFRIPLAYAPDVFHAALSKAQDILISDADADNIRARIPAWHAKSVRAQSFLLLPIVVDGKPLALLYADKTDQPMRLPGPVLNLLKALRNQAALAIRHKTLN